MNQTIFKKYYRIIKFLFWGMLFCIYFFFLLSADVLPIEGVLIGAIVMTVTFAIGIYAHIRYIFPLLKQKRWLTYGLGIIAIFVFFFGIDFLLSILDGGLEEFKIDTPVQFFTTFIFFAFLLTVGSIIHLLGEKIMESIEHQIELSNEKLTAELNFLKAQINPHFLFNTLNNIYSYAYIQHPETPAMIKKLSSILRYIVYDCKVERTLLKKEVENMNNLFSLYQMKNDEQKGLVFYQPKNCNGGLQIAPLILINLLENAFKHSDALNNKNGFIHAKTEVDKRDILHFEIANSVKKNQLKNTEKGIGQQNISTQLDLLYPNKYDLQTELNNHIFTLKLQLQLDRKDR